MNREQIKEMLTDDKTLNQVIGERDHWESKATELASLVGNFFKNPVGEHSNTNCPVNNAIELLTPPTTRTNIMKIRCIKEIKGFTIGKTYTAFRSNIIGEPIVEILDDQSRATKATPETVEYFEEVKIKDEILELVEAALLDTPDTEDHAALIAELREVAVEITGVVG